MRPLTCIFILLTGCDVGSADPNDRTTVTSEGPEEIDGTYLDAERGACFGGIGGAIRCAGSPCDAGLGEAECAATSGCIRSYTEDDAGALAFRDCFPIDERSTAAGTCEALGANACVTRADCSAVYQGVSLFSAFVRCQA